MDDDPIVAARTLRTIVGHACYVAGIEQGDLDVARATERHLIQLTGRAKSSELEVLRTYAFIHHTQPMASDPLEVVRTMYLILTEGYDPFQPN